MAFTWVDSDEMQLGDEDPEGELKRDVECLLEELEEYRPEEGARPYIREFEVDDY